MKLGILGDLQLTNRGPEKRLDNYWETLYGKLSQALSIFDKHKCDCIIQVGDFFDAPTVANKIVVAIIELLYCYGKSGEQRIFCVFGQHDISGHSKFTLPNSPLSLLQAARVVKILNDKPVYAGEGGDSTHAFYGASFGEDIPEPSEESYNILVTHRMIGDRPLWPSQELPGPRQFLRKNPGYNLICCGDYHYRFTETWNGRTIINPGAIVRKTTGKFDLEHKPAVVVFDTNTDEVKIIELNAKPIEEVFDLTKKVEKKDNSALVELVERIKESGDRLSGWKHILVKVLEERKSNQRVKDIIDEKLEKVRKKNG